MPRADVPYPSREICSLKCQIDALQRQINELMKSVNGVQGDGQGNVSLISGDPAVVINNDAVHNEIEISLDQSQLPAADVTSVNGQTGVVYLDAHNLYNGGRTLNQEIALLNAATALNGVRIQNEATARQNADGTLQTNINNLQASIPGEAATAVANDPTVSQLATDVPNKLDKITSGSSLKAYTHVGAVQGEKAVVDGVDADSIGIRDADGRMHAADPASGATDKTLTTANWISQTGDNAPNNLVHRTGNETIAGDKLFYNNMPFTLFFSSTTSGWKEVFKIKHTQVQTVTYSLFFRVFDKSNGKYIVAMAYGRTGQVTYTPGVVVSYEPTNFCITYNADDSLSIWCNVQRFIANAEIYTRGNSNTTAVGGNIEAGTLLLSNKPAVGDDYLLVIDGAQM